MAPSTRRPSSQAVAMAKRMREIQLRGTRSSNTKRSNGATSRGTSVQAASKLSLKRQKRLKGKRAMKREGLKLLKRGCVTMSRIVRRKIIGKRMTVQFNQKGQPIGKAGKEMQSYIGVLARKKVPISIPTWKDVLVEQKNKIWEGIKLSFLLRPEHKRMVLISAGAKWREFKSHLTTRYILPHRDNLEIIESRPEDYLFINQDDWEIFVQDRLSDSFLELHEKQKRKRALSKYPHRLSRKGYAGLEEELSATMDEAELDRATMWIKARQDKNGGFKDPLVEEKAKEIADLKKKEAEGELSTSGSDDVLTLALGNPEHTGIIRGVGANVRQAAYFNLPKRRKQSVEQSLRLSVQKIMEQEREKILAKERAIWEERLKTLEARVLMNPMVTESPKDSTIDREVGSGQGSSNMHEKAANAIEKQIPSTVRKSLDLEPHVEEPVEVVNPIDGVNLNAIEKGQPIGLVVVDLEIQEGEFQAQTIGKECHLALGSTDNVVAIATVIEVNNENNSQLIHGVPLGEGNMRVSIVRSLVDEAKLPFPIENEIMTVRDAIGTYVAWPKNLIVFPVEFQKMAAKSRGMRKRKRVEEDEYHEEDIDMASLPTTLPPSLP
ncbi:uncharacterized protein LOC112194446 [Rosa chinensis]|uniref:uncharacterized protein LOC112194446 n=1 Tax=Rosa chinensis TaxID=74649 RepID=UPI000D08CAF4|nr:uncharacterized protein LOC112194446 [Rosa chinensis]